MLIDSHVHVGDWKYFDSFGRTYSGFREIVQTLEQKDFYGAVLMPSELKKNGDLLDEIRTHRDSGGSFRCWFFPWLNPERGEDIRFTESHIQDIDGLKFHPSLDRVRFAEKTHRPFLDLAEAHGLPILVHCGAWVEMADYRFVLDVAESRPAVDFILAHQGGATYEQKIRSTLDVKARGLQNVYFDIAGTHEYWLLEKCVDELGAERFLLASDFPIRDASLYPLLVEGSRVNLRDQMLIKAQNAIRLLSKKNGSLNRQGR